MRRFWESVENNTKSQCWGAYSNRVTRFLDYESNIVEMPETVEAPHFNASLVAKKISRVKNDPKQEAEGDVLTPRMEWVQKQLEELGLKYLDTTCRNDRRHSSFVTAVPFISDYGKPATFYVASTNQYEGKGKYSTDRISSLIMALSLAAQLKESTEYKNVVILFVNQHHVSGSAYLIEEIIQKRYVNVSASAIVELCHFVGTYPIVDTPYFSKEESVFDSLKSKVGKQAVPESLKNCQLTEELSDLEYEAVRFGSTIDDELYEELLDESMDETLYTAKSQVNFCTTNESKAISNLLYQHAIIMSSYNYYNELDQNYKH